MSEFPSPAPLLPEILALHGRWRAERAAVIVGDEHRSWAEFSSDNHRFAHGLRAAGIKTGDRVGIFMSSGHAMMTALFGTLAAGAASVPINTSVSDDAIVAMLTDAQIRALVVSNGHRERFDALLARLPPDLLRICDAPAPGWRGMNGLATDQPASLPAVDLSDAHPLNIIYSSGTTVRCSRSGCIRTFPGWRCCARCWPAERW